MSDAAARTPSLSIVIGSVAGAPFVDECLHALAGQARDDGVDVIVAVRDGREAERLARAFPWARVLCGAATESIPQLRRRGALEARGDIVGVLEEHCVPAADWAVHVRRAHRDGAYAAAGGPIADGAYTRLRDWVVYLLEYSDALPPWVDGEVSALNGANIAYRRDVLLAHEALLGDGYWEGTLHPALVAGGHRLRAVPHMQVRKSGPFPFGEYLRQRYWFSRAFAGARARRMSGARRTMYLAAVPLLPAVLLGRVTGRVWRSRAHVGRFVLGLPLLLPVLVVYAAGEWIGGLLGPGDALSRVR